MRKWEFWATPKGGAPKLLHTAWVADDTLVSERVEMFGEVPVRRFEAWGPKGTVREQAAKVIADTIGDPTNRLAESVLDRLCGWLESNNLLDSVFEQQTTPSQLIAMLRGRPRPAADKQDDPLMADYWFRAWSRGLITRREAMEHLPAPKPTVEHTDLNCPVCHALSASVHLFLHEDWHKTNDTGSAPGAKP